jgi:hypothetical protein
MKRFVTEKDPLEPVTVAIDWLTHGHLTLTTTLSNPEVTITSSSDPDAKDMVSGSSEIEVTANAIWQKQLIIDGLDGSDYVVVFEADTDDESWPHLVERVVLRCRMDRP